MRGCRHKRRMRRHKLLMIDSERANSVEDLMCWSCGSLLPLGEANDEPEAVKVEIRAAEIAAITTVYGCTARAGRMSPDEGEGWAKHESGGNPVANDEHQSLPLRGWVASRHAGYLARCISTHSDSDAGRGRG